MPLRETPFKCMKVLKSSLNTWYCENRWDDFDPYLYTLQAFADCISQVDVEIAMDLQYSYINTYKYT